MKTTNPFLFTTAIIFLLIPFLSKAQDTITRKDINRLWVDMRNEALINIGVLYELRDSSIVMSFSSNKKDYLRNDLEKIELGINDINTIKIRRKNSILKGFLIGAGIGCAIGVIYGFSKGDDPPAGRYFNLRFSAEEKAIGCGFLGFLGGGIFGVMIGSINVKIPINGSKTEYQKHKQKLRKYSVLK